MAPSGRLYVNSEDLYAIEPDGTVAWTRTHFGSYVVGLAADGTVTVGNGRNVFAYDDQGSALWTFTESPRSGGFFAVND